VSLNGSNIIIVKTKFIEYWGGRNVLETVSKMQWYEDSVCPSSVLRPRPAEHMRHGSGQPGSYFKKFHNFSLQTNWTKCRDGIGSRSKSRILPSSPVLPQNYPTLELFFYALFDLLIVFFFFIVSALRQDWSQSAADY